jgi:type IV fimbrial biogenesis protein FimT
MFEPTVKMNISRREHGFTLVELLTTIIIIGVLASIALPSFRTFTAGQRIKNASFDLSSMITLTRSEAIKRNANVTLKLDPLTNTFKITATGIATPIRTQEMFTGVSLNCIDTTTHTATTCPTTGIVYGGNGRLVSAFGPLQISSINNSTTDTRCISIDLSGRPNSKKGNC